VCRGWEGGCRGGGLVFPGRARKTFKARPGDNFSGIFFGEGHDISSHDEGGGGKAPIIMRRPGRASGGSYTHNNGSLGLGLRDVIGPRRSRARGIRGP